MRKHRVAAATVLLLMVAVGTPMAQNFTPAQLAAMESFTKKQSDIFTKTLEAQQAASEPKQKSNKSVEAQLNVGALPLGINNEQQESVKYKLKSYQGDDPLKGTHLPSRLFRVPYNGRN